jgi:hypothetical protein
MSFDIRSPGIMGEFPLLRLNNYCSHPASALFQAIMATMYIKMYDASGTFQGLKISSTPPDLSTRL